jgi:hypothetical protein
MADLNSLLHWAIENTPTDQGGSGSAPTPAAAAAAPGGMQLTFKPAAPGQQPNAGTLATFHPDDPQHDAGLAPPAAEEPKRESQLSTEMLDLIMGKPDSVTMKEKMAIASNVSADVDERVMALDDFEMLVELIDNANNMPVLKLWQPLLALVNDPIDEIARHALWVAGTAIQNNLKGQAAVSRNLEAKLTPVLHLRRPPARARQAVPRDGEHAGRHPRQGGVRALGRAQALAPRHRRTRRTGQPRVLCAAGRCCRQRPRDPPQGVLHARHDRQPGARRVQWRDAERGAQHD